MDDVMGLIDRAHHGDERARAQLVEQNMKSEKVTKQINDCPPLLRQRYRERGSVPDRSHRAYESNR